MSAHQLRLLLVEDSADDVRLIERTLERGGFALDLSVVESAEALREALAEGRFEIVLTDHELRGFDSGDVLATLAELAPELPCLLVSGKVGEEVVGQAMRQGAVDYVAKDNLGRLPTAVGRALGDQQRSRERAASEQALARSGRQFEAVFLNARDAMLIVDDQRRLVDVNPATAEMLAMPREKLLELKIDQLMPEAWRVNAEHVWAQFLGAGARRGEVEIVRADGALVATEYTAAADFLPGRHIMVLRDIRERRAAETEVKHRIAQQQTITELGERALREKSIDLLMDLATTRVAATLGVEVASILELRMGESSFAVRAETGIERSRPGVRLPYGVSMRSLESFTVGQQEAVLVGDYEVEARFDRTPTLKALGIRSALSVAIPGKAHAFGVLAAGSTEPHAFDPFDASFLTAVAHLLGDALERARSEAETQKRALHDALTGLPNRTLFFDRLELGLARSKRIGSRLAVIFLDIDHFKALNDRLGHLAADRVLAQVAARIERATRGSDTVARFGGDEFVVLCEDLTGEEDEIERLIARLLSALDRPFLFAGEPHKLSASIGVAFSDADSVDGEALLRDADIALYRSKETGRGGWTVATEEMRLAVITRSETKHALERAIESNELVVHYQPIVAIAGGELCAVEALVRWEDPERGLIPPGQFIPLAEESGLILRLGEWVLREACHQTTRWRAEFGEQAPLPIHVNFSARQIAQAGLPERVAEILEETGAMASDIAVEITETALIDDMGAPTTVLGEFRSMGMTVVLDDFGTGYSSLSYLESFPIHTLKIDRAFVSRLERATEPAPIVTAIIGIAQALGVGTVAEGVETAEQAAAVAALGCEHAQGYFFARPVPAERITELVRDDAPLRQRASEASAVAFVAPAAARPRAGGPRATTSPASVGEHREAFLAALLAADSHAAEDAVYSALADEIAPDAIGARIIGAAMVEIGGLWERGELSVAGEHLATGIAAQSAALVTGVHGVLGGPLPILQAPQTVMLANVEGDDHVIGLRMVADTLRALGADVLYLGSKVPSAELCDAAARAQPHIIGLSLTLPELAPRLARQAAALRAVCPDARILLGGQGVDPELAGRIGATFVRDVEELVDEARSWPVRRAALVGAS